MFDNRKQKVPAVFIEKIEIDKIVDNLRKMKSVNLKEMTALLKKQRELRRMCEMFCHMHKVDQDGDGSPAGGIVGRYLNTTAIAA